MAMFTRRQSSLALGIGIAALAALARESAAQAPVTQDAPARRPDAIVNLRTTEGARIVAATWRYHDAAIVPATNHAPGPDLRPSGAPTQTFDVGPRGDQSAIDDAAWPVIAPESLEARRGRGRLSFGWYHLDLTVPDRVGTIDTRGATLIFEIVVDDYAEVWVDGRQPLVLGQSGGAVARGWNSPNRVVLTRDARPGQHVRVAVFAANGPLSNPPENFIWVRSATVDVYGAAEPPIRYATGGSIQRVAPALDAVIDTASRIERIATGFQFTEGPVWHPDGYLLFSDPNENTIYRWSPDGQLSIYRVKSGYTGTDIGEYHQPGSNGLTLDAEGRLTIDEHGNRRVTRLEKNGTITVVADLYDGKRLNSPNDLVYKSDGSLWFTDPPFGLPRVFDDARKELPYSGIFRLANGRLQLAARDLVGPNGIAFSPDERYLYVTNWDPKRKVINRYEVRMDGSLAPATQFFSMQDAPGEEALDGLKVDQRGNLFASGPGGVWIISPEGRHLGTIRAPELAANMAWGDDDARTLYMTARTSIYRVRVKIPGIRPPLAPKTAALTKEER
jgi:gluconolactonase